MALAPDAALRIRRATTADVAPLVQLARQSFRDAYRGLDDPDEIEDYVTRHFTPQAFEAVLAEPAAVLLVAELDAHLVGYAHLQPTPAPACVDGPAPIELCRLYLADAKIGRGWGRALMAAVMREAAAAGGRTLWLGVYSRNERARAFYRRWGLEDVGVKTFVFGGRPYDDPVMAGPVAPQAQP